MTKKQTWIAGAVVLVALYLNARKRQQATMQVGAVTAPVSAAIVTTPFYQNWQP
jgi:hypothetical protein